jgi:YHS domain-containing protein
MLAFDCAQARRRHRPIMKTHPISFLPGLIAAIAVPVIVNAASLSRGLLSNPTDIGKDKGMVVLAETAKARMSVDKDGVILKGYDPVAYFTRHQPVKGNPAIQTKFGGAIYHFASAANKAAFDKNPSKYAPQYGGFCASHLSKGKGALADGDPTVFSIYKGKLYVCSDADGMKEFRSNIDKNIRNADENWVTHFGWHGNPSLR